jgi:hypothetical protein
MEWLTLGLNDVIPYPEDQIGPIRHNLAIYLSTSWDVEPSRRLLDLANSGYKKLQKAYLDVGFLSTDNALHPYYNPNSDYVNGVSS